MKNYLKIYLKTFSFIFISYFLISIILATIIHFIQMPNLIYNSIIHVFAYLIIIMSSIYFFKQINTKLLVHSCFFAMGYLLITLLINFNDINIIFLITRPLTFILTSTALNYFGK